MIKAVIFDMFETLVTLFQGKTYFSEDIAEDLGIGMNDFRREWHVTEKDRTEKARDLYGRDGRHDRRKAETGARGYVLRDSG